MSRGLLGVWALMMALAAAPAPGDWQEQARQLTARTDQMTVVGRDGWLFLRAELRHLGADEFWGERAVSVSQATRPEHADPLPAILDFKRQLDELGIELLIVPVPPKAAIYPDLIFELEPGAELPTTLHQQFYALLRDNGVEVLDITSDFLSARDQPPAPVFCRTDTHWSGIGAVKTAELIEEHIRGREWLVQHVQQHRVDLRERWEEVTIEGDLLRALPEPRPQRETLRLRFIETDAGEPIDPGRDSPIILLGDSHTLVFHAGGDMHARGAGLADQLAFELGVPVDLHGVRGSGATPARINLARAARADPGYLDGKKLVIWCFSAREFTESDGWRPVPIVPPAR